MKNKCITIPKIDLHCHLDGSVKESVLIELAQKDGRQISEKEAKKLLQVHESCQSLAEYLSCFDLPLHYLQAEDGLKKAAYALAMDAAAENVKYIEVRFAPSYLMNQGLTVQKIIASVLMGLEEAEKNADIRTGIIVCGMRNISMEENIRMLKSAMEFYGNGVVACDLAGDELAYPTKLFADFFVLAKKLGIPFTIHSGECGSKENIKTALQLGAKRLGHGIAMADDIKLMRRCADINVGVELCPTSNLHTKAVSSYKEYPLRTMMEAGVMVSVNTDNRTVSNTNSTKEFLHMVEDLNLCEEDLKQIYTCSVEMAFADDACKEQLLKKWSL